MATAVNEHTGAFMRTKSGNYKLFAENYNLLNSGITIEDKMETRFPITITVSSQLHKELSKLAKELEVPVEQVAQDIFLLACAEE